MTKKILHIIDSMGLGGAQSVVQGIFEGQRENQNIFLYALRKRDINVKIEHSNVFSNISQNKFSFPLFKLTKFIQEHKIEVLHCHLAKSQIMGGVLKIFFFPNIQLVFHEHGQIFETGKIYPFLMKCFKNKIDTYIAVSEATKAEILQKTGCNREKIKVLYNYVDIDKFKKIENFDKTQAKEKYGFKESDFVIGFASRLVEDKGWREFVGAAKELIVTHTQFKFIIGGDGPDREKIQDYITKNNLENHVFLVGYIQDMVSFYNTIDLFVFPSHRESMGLTGLEANACGCPVIASNIPGLNEVMVDGENALLFEKGNHQDLKIKINNLYDNFEENKKKIIQIGYNIVQQYSLEKYIQKLIPIYE